MSRAVASSRGPHATIEQYYSVGRRLTGGGGMCTGSEVVRGTRIDDGQDFCIKLIHFGFTSSREDCEQIQAMTEVRHPGIITLEDWFETENMLFLVMEMAHGGELFGRIAVRGVFTERDAANCFRQILDAIAHMHARGIVHCDLKPESFVYQDDTDNQIKIADLGSAHFIPGGEEGGKQLRARQLGTLPFTSPEILLNQGFTCKSDMWSLGVILYILLSGITPFSKRPGDTDRNVRLNITRGCWRFYETHFANVSKEARNLVSHLLVVNPHNRLDCQQALQHPWVLQGHAPEQPLGDAFLVDIANFNSLRGMYKLSSHALVGLVSRFAQPDAIAAISADLKNIPRVLQEGSIQPIVSLAYSRVDHERESACNALANLALRDEFQELIVREGALRRLNQLALKKPPTSANVRFFVALALARLAKEPDVRIPMLEQKVNAGEDRTPTVRALVHLAQPPPTNPSRVSRQAVQALALLSLEQKLHEELLSAGMPDANVRGGVRPAVLEGLLWQAAENQPADFKRSALKALKTIFASVRLVLRRIFASKMPPFDTENPRKVHVLNEQMNIIWETTRTRASADKEQDTGESKSNAANRMSGLASMLLVIRDDGILEEMIQLGGIQPWHEALQTVGVPPGFPSLYDGDPSPELNRTVSQIFKTMDLAPYQTHLNLCQKILQEVTGCAMTRSVEHLCTTLEGRREYTTVESIEAEEFRIDLSPTNVMRIQEAQQKLVTYRNKLIRQICEIKGNGVQLPQLVNELIADLTSVILCFTDLIYLEKSS